MTRRRALIGAAIGAGLGCWVVRRNRRDAAHPPAIAAAAPVGGAPHRRPRAGRCRVLVLPLLFAVTVLAWPWDGVIDAASGVASQVKKLVKDAVQELWNYIDATFNFLAKIFAYVRQAASDIINGLEDLVSRLVEGALSTAFGWVLNVYHWVDTTADAIRNEVARWVQDVRDLANAAAALARGLVDAAIRWVVENVYHPLLAALGDLTRFVLSSIGSAIDVFWRNVVQPVIDLVAQIVRNVEGLIDYVAKIIEPMFAVLRKAFWFLVFVAEHPLDWWVLMFQEVAHRAPSLWIDFTRRALDQHGTEIEDAVTKWLQS